MDFFDFEPNFQPYGWDRPFQKKYKTTADAIETLCELSIASAQTLTLTDESGEISIVKCNPEEIEVIRPRPGKQFVAATSNFNFKKMRAYRNSAIDDWRCLVRRLRPQEEADLEGRRGNPSRKYFKQDDRLKLD